jgi:putative endonuclease
MAGWMYILECADGTYYTGSTFDVGKRFMEHQRMVGANYTAKRLPVKLVYVERYDRTDQAFSREKQVQGWSHVKKKALIDRAHYTLHQLAICRTEKQNLDD